jgi:hypothetical protein
MQTDLMKAARAVAYCLGMIFAGKPVPLFRVMLGDHRLLGEMFAMRQ